MFHNPQHLEKELFTLKIISIVVLEFIPYCVSLFTLVAIILSQAKSWLQLWCPYVT